MNTSVPNGIRIGPQHDANARESLKQAEPCARDDASEHGGTLQPQGVPQPAIEIDAVEAALADALRGATAAARWDVVAQLAGELQARRQARQAPEVVSLELARQKRNGGKP